MRKFCSIIIVISSMFLLISCDGSTSDSDVAEFQINEILDDIVENFNNHDLDAIMAFYHNDFLHNGDNLAYVRYDWQARMVGYLTMEIEDVEVEKDGLDAVASFTMILSTYDEDFYYLEPADHGDFSYFRKELTSWEIYGNQEYDSSSGYKLIIDTEPQNASIYLDDASMYQYTPAVLQSLPAGTYTLRLYKYGYNEWQQEVNVPHVLEIEHSFVAPGYPVPKFDLDSPLNGINYSSETVSLAGLLRNKASNGVTNDFDGTRYIMSLNGQETIHQTNGVLVELLHIQPGENQLQLRATNADGNTGWSNTITFQGAF